MLWIIWQTDGRIYIILNDCCVVQEDLDGDGLTNAEDDDDDGDGILDGDEDDDGDGIENDEVRYDGCIARVFTIIQSYRNVLYKTFFLSKILDKSFLPTF